MEIEPKLKPIAFRGGVVTFSVPDHWTEAEEEGAGLYYEDTPDAGVLRLTVITATNPRPVTAERLIELMPDFAPSEKYRLETLPNGNVLLRFVAAQAEEGQAVLIYYWVVGSPVPPHTAHFANFSYTLPAARAKDPAVREELALLELSVREAVFAGNGEERPPVETV